VRPAFLAFVLLGACASSTRVPEPLAQGVPLAPQAVSSVDVSDDGRTITVTTLAFRQDPNVWVLSSEGKILFGRNVAPWAPFQGAALDGGQAFGTGLAYSRVTSPYPTMALFGGEKDPETVLEDSLGEWGWLRYGGGDWRNGWTASLLGDLVVRADGSLITVRGHNGATKLLPTGEPGKYPMKSERPFRMAASGDGRAIACGYVLPDPGSGLHAPPALVTVTGTSDAKELWSFTPAGPAPRVPPLPEPSRDFPALAEHFKMTPDVLVPFRVAASVAPNADGTRAAAADYGGWLWVRRTPAIGAWNPPYHVIPFVPRQRGRMLLATASGSSMVEFPKEGLFEVVSNAQGDRVWAVPMSWFARGMAGAPWLPADQDAREIFEYDPARGGWKTAWTLPDALSDFALHPDGRRAIVSCWDGNLHSDGVSTQVGGPARVKWSRDGSFAIAGTAAGEVVCIEAGGKVRWRLQLPSTPVPAVDPPLKPVYEGIPVYSVGRTGKEHAYVGDTWLVKSEAGGILIDAGGSSSIPFTLAKIRSAGADIQNVRHLLHTHSHGDHAGAAYLWRSMGLEIVAPESAAFALSWLMPMLTDYGVWVPRPVDVPLPLKRAGDEAEITLAGLKIRAVFVPGHSMDSAIYLLELGGKHVAFTGDVGFQAPSDILHRCWTDSENAATVIQVVKTKVIPFHPDVVFTGHGGRPEGTAFLEDLVKRSEESIQKARSK
jgi:glyoxylase-like metal-dependent hydrolase (beta-lactamase superfamily II)